MLWNWSMDNYNTEMIENFAFGCNGPPTTTNKLLRIMELRDSLTYQALCGILHSQYPVVRRDLHKLLYLQVIVWHSDARYEFTVRS